MMKVLMNKAIRIMQAKIKKEGREGVSIRNSFF
jgi:hypothetical protein